MLPAIRASSHFCHHHDQKSRLLFSASVLLPSPTATSRIIIAIVDPQVHLQIPSGSRPQYPCAHSHIFASRAPTTAAPQPLSIARAVPPRPPSAPPVLAGPCSLRYRHIRIQLCHLSLCVNNSRCDHNLISPPVGRGYIRLRASQVATMFGRRRRAASNPVRFPICVSRQIPTSYLARKSRDVPLN